MKKIIVCLFCISMLNILPVYAGEATETIPSQDAMISVSVPSFHTLSIETTGNAEVFLNGETGTVFNIERLSEPVLEIKTPDDEELVSVTLNGEDIRNMFVDGKYQLPPVYENLTLEIETEKVKTETLKTEAVKTETEPPSVYRVTFNTNDDTTVTSQTVIQNGKIVKPADPIRKGYIFGGWYTDTNFTQEYNFSAVVADNITLYAKWIPKTYKVTVTIRGDTDVLDAATLDLLKNGTSYQSVSGTGTGVYSFSNVMLGTYDLDVTIKSQKQSMSHLFSVTANDIE